MSAFDDLTLYGFKYYIQLLLIIDYVITKTGSNWRFVDRRNTFEHNKLIFETKMLKKILDVYISIFSRF